MKMSIAPGRDRGDHANSPLLSASSSSTLSYDSINDEERHEPPRPESKLSPSDVDADVIPETSVVGRTLTWQSAYMLTISRVLGSGIFATPGVILASVGSPGLSLTLWIVGAILAYFGLTVSLEYGCMLPRSGGEKVYLEFTYRKPKYLVSVLIATQAILLGFSASNCIVFAQYVLFAFGTEGTELLRKILAAGLLTWITIVHSCFMKTGIQIQDFLGWVKICMIVFMILSGLFVVLLRSNDDIPAQHHPSTMALDGTWDGLWRGTIWAWGTIATSLFKVFYSYAGLNNVNNVMNEVKDPVRTLRSVSLTALATACGMYLLINIAYFLVIPVEEAKTSGELIAALFFERVFGDAIGRRILPIMVALSGMGNVMVVTFALSRLNQEIARTGLIPMSRLLSSTAPFGSPLGGLLLHYIPSLLVIIIPSGDIYSFILEVEGFPAQFVSLAVCFGLVWLRFIRPDLKRPYKAWIPGVFVRMLVSAALIAAPFFPGEAQKRQDGFWGAGYAVVGITMMTFGVLYWYLWTIALPKWRGYKLEDETEVLDDGTTVTTLKHIPR